jgi:purine-cytosine permease-like protein
VPTMTATEQRRAHRAEHREDYALQVVPDSYRQWGSISIFGIMMGITTAMFFLAWGGSLVLAFGTTNLIVGMVFATLFIGTIGYFLVRTSAETGLDTDLLTIDSFGWRGSGLTSFIYACNFLIFSALEGAIIAHAVHERFVWIPLGLLYAAFGLLFIPLTWYGMTTMNWIMWITIPFYFILLGISIVAAANAGGSAEFFGYSPSQSPAGGPGALQVAASSLALIINATVAGDIGRFIPRQKIRKTALAVGYGFEALTFLGATLLGAWFAVKLNDTNPGSYFPTLLGTWGVGFVIITQLRINVVNTYSGSLAFANFFARVFNFRPGRHWWVALSCVIAVVLMFVGVLNHLTQILTFESVFIIAWIMALLSDRLVTKRPFQASIYGSTQDPVQIRARSNRIGLAAVIVALIPSVAMAFGLAGPLGRTLAPFVSASIAFAAVPLIAWFKSKIARRQTMRLRLPL